MPGGRGPNPGPRAHLPAPPPAGFHPSPHRSAALRTVKPAGKEQRALAFVGERQGAA